MATYTPPSDSMFADYDAVLATWPEGLLRRVWLELKAAAKDATTPRRRARLESSADHVEDYLADLRMERETAMRKYLELRAGHVSRMMAGV